MLIDTRCASARRLAQSTMAHRYAQPQAMKM